MGIQVIEVYVQGLQGPKGGDGEGLPTGGTKGQALVKASNAEHDYEWGDPYTDTAGEIKGKLEGLAADERLDASAIKNIPTTPKDTAQEIVAKVENLSGDDRLDASAIKNIPTTPRDTAQEIVAKVETLSGNDRLDAGSIKNIPSDTATVIVGKIETLSGDDRLDAGSIKNIPITPKDTAQEIVAKVETLSGDDRLDAGSIRNIPSDTAAVIVGKIETLTSDDRLDASAIKNLPAVTKDTALEIVAKVESLSGDDRLDAGSVKNIPAKDTAAQLVSKIETLTGDDRLAATSIKGLAVALEAYQTVYVSNVGDDTASGRNPEKPVKTIAKAVEIINGLPSSADKLISCVDSSQFTEDFAVPNTVNVSMPLATLTGNFTADAHSYDVYIFREITGNSVLGAGSFFKVELLYGSVTLAARDNSSVIVEVNKFGVGSLNTPLAAEGQLSLKIDLVHATFAYHDNASPLVKSGWIESTLYGDTEESATQLKDKLEGLSGNDRLDASAIKNLPSGGSGGHTLYQFPNFNSGGGAGKYGWFDIIVWDALVAPDVPEYSAHVRIGFQGSLNMSEHHLEASGIRSGAISSEDNPFQLTIRNSNSTHNKESKSIYRVVRDSLDIASKVRLQVYQEYDEATNLYIIDESGLGLSPITSVNPVPYTDTATQVVNSELDVSSWQKHDIHLGTSGGIAADNIGDISGTAAWIDFEKGDVDIYAGDQIVGKFEKDGVKLTGGEYGSWRVSTSNAFETALTYPTLVEATNPSNTVSLEVSDVSTGTGAWSRYFYSGAGKYAVGADADNSILRFRFQGVDTNTSITLGLAIFSIFGSTWEIRSPTGDVLDTFVQSGGNTTQNRMFTFEVTESMRDNGEAIVTLHHTAGGYANPDALLDWGFSINSVEPVRNPNAVVQIDSNYRGVMLPRISPDNTINHPVGSIALDKSINNSPIWNSGEGWNDIKTANFKTQPTFVDASYFSQVGDGQLETFGWYSHSDVVLPVQTVDGYGGFSRLLHINDTSTGTISGAIRNLTTSEAVILSDNGFRWDFDWLPEEGSVLHYIEFDSSFHAGQGRFLISVNHTGGQVDITNEADSQTAIAPISRMLKFACFVAAGSSDMQVYVDGVFAFTFAYNAGSGGSNRIHHTSGTSSGIDKSGYLLASNLITMPAVSFTPTLDEMYSSLELFIPNINTPSKVTVPRGVFKIGTEFKVVNGSSLVCDVSGYADDAQSFGGKASFQVPPFTAVTFIQTATPFGSYWAIDAAVERTLTFTVDGSHILQTRKGNFFGDITVTSVGTGHFRAALQHNLLPANTCIQATVNNGVDGWKKNASVDWDLGQVNVHTGDVSTGTAESLPVTITVTW